MRWNMALSTGKISMTLKQDALMARVSNTAFLWMRSSPSTSATTINKLAEGTQLLVLAQQGDWTQVRLGAQTGYCMTSYLTIYNGETISLHYGQDFLPEGESLKRVQELMIELGYMDGTASGVYDLETIEAVKAFQKRNDLSVDGKAGRYTIQALFSGDAKAAASDYVPVEGSTSSSDSDDSSSSSSSSSGSTSGSGSLNAFISAAMCGAARARIPSTAPASSTGAYARQGSARSI